MDENKQEQIISKLDQLLAKNPKNEEIVQSIKSMRAEIQNQEPRIQTGQENQAAAQATPIAPINNEELQRRLAEHRAQKAAMMAEEEKKHFSYDVKQQATDEERKANAKLTELKNSLVTPLYNVTIHDFYAVKDKLMQTQLYQLLSKMPKGGLHHVHTTAAPHVDVFIELTYEPETYYNEREGLFKVFQNPANKEDGFVQCQEMRSFYAEPSEYDEILRNQILLTRSEQFGLESHDIWGFFQHKFSRIAGLAKYRPFFERLLKANIDACIEQNIFIVELRHTTGCLFDKQVNTTGPKLVNKIPTMTLLDELAMIQGIIDEAKTRCPHFEMTLILTSYKMVGQAHVTKILNHIKLGKEHYPDLVVGYDMVNEEEYTPLISEYMPSILGAQEAAGVTHNLHTFFHAGETHDRTITNMHDAVLLNSKRLGHGFQLALFPNLLQEIIKRDICVEACPLSNMVLGYTLDMRNHPVRYMMHQGLQTSINSDDPGFFHYSGVTLDFVYATLGWELDLWDLKKLSLNGIKYSTVSDEKKAHLLNNVFPPQWAEFISQLSALTVTDSAENLKPDPVCQ